MRLFAAITIPARERKRLFKASALLREAGLPVRWAEVDAIHLSLKFLGEVPKDRVGRVRGSLAAVAAKSRPFEVGLGGFGAFPSLRKPRVIWAGAYASPELRCLKHDLEWEFAALGYEREARAFHPHLTLGRARPEAAAGDFRNLEDLVEPLKYQGALTVNSVVLLRSILGPQGASYDTIDTVRLGESTPTRASA
ncbi:MAG TPA: RNA 2',3'-cyclic phosphodiesterase [Longimicrobiales bacterium]|nr:RNA 2',3'-cyclic phosphodiesterase [Longimicrobiales bacterium]